MQELASSAAPRRGGQARRGPRGVRRAAPVSVMRIGGMGYGVIGLALRRAGFPGALVLGAVQAGGAGRAAAAGGAVAVAVACE